MKGVQIVKREITFVPGLYKIFDEILVNASDNRQRDPANMNEIQVNINPKKGKISIWNNGKGIPIQLHKKEGKISVAPFSEVHQVGNITCRIIYSRISTWSITHWF